MLSKGLHLSQKSCVPYAMSLLERAIVDRVPEAPAFVQMFPSSEVTPSPLAPGVRPSMVFGDRDSGTVRQKPAEDVATNARGSAAIN